MNRKNIYLSFLVFILFFLNECSFDSKTGIWSGQEEELRRVAKLEKENKVNRFKIFSTSEEFLEEIKTKKVVSLSKSTKNSFWEMSGLNLQNYLGNLYLEGTDNKFLKKKIGKNKFKIFQKMHPPLFFENNLIISDDKGTIYKINKKGKVYWKKNIYEKIYKKLHKNLTFSIYNNNLYVADNIGFVYVLSYDHGEVIWKKNFGVPFKSHIKVFDDKIYIIDQDNRILCIENKKGSKIWDIPTVQTFIKSQNLLGMAISKKGNLVILSSAGDVLNINSKNGKIFWSMNSLTSLSTYATDFFKSSDIVLTENEVLFSSLSSTYSLNLSNGYINWKSTVSSSSKPIVNANNIFLVTDQGYFVNLDRATGKIIWSTDILKNLKKRKRFTQISGFVLGSDKIYATTLNGYLIVSSATNGKIETHTKIAKAINTSPIISNGELYILTSGSKILGFR